MRWILICSAILMIVDLVGVWGYHRMAMKATVAPDALEQLKGKDSVFVVFFHGPGPDTGIGLDDQTLQRIYKASRAYQKNSMDDFLMLGGHWRSNAKRPMAMYKFARGQDLPADHLYSDNWSYDTLTNLEALVQLQKIHQWRHLVLCSSALHLMRIRSLVSQFQLSKNVRLHYLNCARQNPAYGLRAIWLETHHEWLGRAMLAILPHKTYRIIMHWQRQD